MITFGWSHPNWSMSQLSSKNINMVHRSGNATLRKMVLFPPMLLMSPTVASRKVLLSDDDFNKFCNNLFFVCEAEWVDSCSHSLRLPQRNFSTIDYQIICTEATVVPRHWNRIFLITVRYMYQISHSTSVYQFIYGYRSSINFDTGKITHCSWSPL